MNRAEELRAELELEEQNEEFLRAKEAFEAGEISHEDYREVKERFHDARVAFREAREERTADAEGVATPETVGVSATTNDMGGEAE